MWPLTRKCSLWFAVFERIAVCTSPTPWICSNSQKQEILGTSQLAVQKFLNPFDLICSKFSSPIHPFSLIIRSNIYFCEPFIRSKIFIGHEWVQKFSSSIHPFHLIHLKNFRHPFIYHSSFILVIRSSISRSISNGLAIRFSSIHLQRVHLKGMFSRERSHNLYSEEKSKWGAGHCF